LESVNHLTFYADRVARQRRKATDAEASALASGIRLRIIRLTFGEALTNKELAARLDKDPATTLYHVRKLADAGFLTAQQPRRGARGAKEIPYLSTGLSWHVSAPGDVVDQAMLEAYLAEVGELEAGDLDQTRLVVDVTEDDREEFRRRLADLLEEFRTRRPGPAGERLAIYVATYPSR
jgi:DNA-binding transcriptional ArsR family regulator